MKRTAFNIIMSILLIIAGLLAQAGGAWGVLECVALGKIDDKFTETFDKISQVEEVIAKLKDADDQYYKGVSAVYTGQTELDRGREVVAEGEEKLAEGREKMAEAQAKYDEAKAKLADAKKVIANAEAQMEASRSDYEEGKALLEKLETLTPLMSKYLSFRSKTIEKIPGFRDTQDWYERNVIPVGADMGLTLPDDVEEFEPYMNEKIAEGNAKLEQYEQAEAQLAEGKKQVEDAEAQLAVAKKELDKGYAVLDAGQAEIDNANEQLDKASTVLSQGVASLAEFDEGVGALDEGLKEFYKLEDVCDKHGNVVVKGIASRLGEDFDWYLRNDDGEVLALKSGNPRLDYDKCLEVCTAYRDYVDDYIDDLNSELTVRWIFNGALIAAGLFAVLTAILTLCKKYAARKLGKILLIAVGACHVYGIAIGYTGFVYPPDETLYSGTLPFFAALLLLAATVPFFFSVRSKKAQLVEGEMPVKPVKVKKEREPLFKRKPAEEKAPKPAPVKKEREPLFKHKPVEKKAAKPATAKPAPVQTERAADVKSVLAEYDEALRRYNAAKKAAEERKDK